MKFIYKTFILALVCIMCTNTYTAQKKELDPTKGLLELKLEKTYWDKEQKKIRSEGYLNSNGFDAIGQRYGKWKFYYKNGKLEELSNFYAGKLNGECIQYYDNGSKKFEGYFFLGTPDSVFRVYYPNGKLAEEGFYNNVPDSIREYAGSYIKIIDALPYKKAGKWTNFSEDGKPISVTLYSIEDQEGKLMEYWNNKGQQLITNGNGTLSETFQSGKPKQEANYKDGKLDGTFKMWNANGNLSEEGHYTNGLQNGNWNYYYAASGKIFQKINYQNGTKHGDFIERMPNDSIAIKGSYHNGEKNGHWVYYFENNSIDMEGSFKDGAQHGEWKFWYPNGQLYYHGNFENGNKEGEWEFFYNKGQLWRKGDFKNNMKNGIWRTYYENKTLLSEGAYLNDKSHGVWTSWYENGQEKDKGSYDNGMMSAFWVGHFPNGKKMYEGNYDRDLKTGTWKHYTSKGTLKDEGNYKILTPLKGSIEIYSLTAQKEQSFKHGYWKSYSDKDGKLVSEGAYNRDRQSGTWKYYYPGGVIVAQEINYNTKGELHGASINNSIKGKIISETNYKEGKKHGDFKVYDKKGKIIVHQVYKNGVKDKDVLKKVSYKYKTK